MEITVTATVPWAGLPDGEHVTVERTPYVDALLDGGRLQQVDPVTGLPLPPPYRCPVCMADRTDEGMDWCGNCRTTLAAEQGV